MKRKALMKIFTIFLVFLFVPLTGEEPYKLPPKIISDILDTPPLPDVIISPDRKWLLMIESESMPRISEFAQPVLGLAGIRITPKNNSIFIGSPRRKGLLLKNVITGKEIRIPLPPATNISSPQWSPDSRNIAFLNIQPEKIELWLADINGKTKILVNSGVSGIAYEPIKWFPDSKRILCLLIPSKRGEPPKKPSVPEGPNIQISEGKPSPARTYQNLLKNPFDEKLFDFYFTSQLTIVEISNGSKKFIGSPSIYEDFEISPDGKYLLTKKIVKPYSYLVPIEFFAKKIEILSSEGKLIKHLSDLPLAENVPINGVPTGQRAHTWAGYKSTVIWAEALDGGNPKTKAEFRDKIMALEEPFNGEAKEIFKTNLRYSSAIFGEDIAIVKEFDRPSRKARLWLLDLNNGAKKLLFDINIEDRYGNPGNPVTWINRAGKRVLIQSPDKKFIYLTGEGASPDGDRPFLDRLELETLKRERIFQSEKNYYEMVIALMDENAEKFITRKESKSEPPNYYLRKKGEEPLALTHFKDPAPQLAGVKKELIRYEREDGVKLSGTLYLPPDWKGERLPLVMWIYPAEFQTADTASQVRSTENRFTFYRGASHLFLLTQGYAILDNPSLPVIGQYGNDTYVLQVVAGAKAAVKKVVEMGVADPDRLGVGGHSYGAFSTANLLAHSDLFKAGVARSGAYNRTLTPFGFQNEDRTLWEAPDTYIRMSPFMYANKINEPILIIHGEADDNPGTFPIQSERLFAAIKGHGGIAKLVLYPYESHGYRARETILDCIYQMIDWFDRYVKNIKQER